MGIVHYLAMTAAEYRCAPEIPPAVSWMACLFSPYGKGLSNLPQDLPPGALLMVSDITPIHGHDPRLIGQQLMERVEALSCHGILLDLQRPGSQETADLAAQLVSALPCPVGVSEPYAQGLNCPVLLPPVPCHVRLKEYLQPWQGREIWLETALGGETVTLREDGCHLSPLSPLSGMEKTFQEEALLCRYQIQDLGDRIDFPLWRTEQDHQRLLEEAAAQSVTLAIGLYQEFAPVRLPQ